MPFQEGQIEEQEQKATSKVVLHFMRHSEKETDPTKKDKDIELTAKGRKLAKDKATSKNVRQSVAFGSPRVRTQETAALVMAGLEDEITGEESLKELEEKLNEEIKIGSKVATDKRLDFNDDMTSPYGKEMLAAYKAKSLLKFIVEHSDARAEELGDTEGSTYARMAAQVAEIVKKYETVARNWDKLARDETKEYNDTLERFLGTHQSLSESFLLKIIEKTKGFEERNKLVEALGSQGFDFVEGYNVEINTVGGEQEIHITFHKEKGGKSLFDYDEVVPLDVVDQILKEGKVDDRKG